MSIIRDGFQSADLDAPVTAPTLNLDFANSQELDPRITFSRGSIGTFVNKNGLIETAPANQPRFDYDPISGECRGLLIEESRVNYFWGTQTGSVGTTVSDGTATGADGVTAKKFVPNLGNRAFPSIGSYTAYTFSVASGGTVDVSFSGYFAAVADGLYVPDIVVEFNTGGSTNPIYAELLPNLSNGTVLQKTGIGANGVSELIAPQITLMPFGMYKVTWSIRYTQGATTRDRVHFYIQCRKKTSSSTATGTYYADGVNGFQFSCIQYEIGAFPTSYIPTTTSSVTRSTELASMTGTNFSSWYNQSEGTFFVSGKATIVQNARILSFNEPTFGVLFVNANEANSAKRGIWGPSTLSNVYGISAFSEVPINSSYKAAAAIKFPNYYTNYSLNGQISTASRLPNTTLYNNVNQLQIGPSAGGGSKGNIISRITYYPKALSPAQLQYLTQ